MSVTHVYFALVVYTIVLGNIINFGIQSWLHIAGGFVRDRAEHGGEAATAVQRDGPPPPGRVRFQERHRQQEPHHQPQVLDHAQAVPGTSICG